MRLSGVYTSTSEQCDMETRPPNTHSMAKKLFQILTSDIFHRHKCYFLFTLLKPDDNDDDDGHCNSF